MTPQNRPVPPAARLTRERLTDHTVIAVHGELDASSTPSERKPEESEMTT